MPENDKGDNAGAGLTQGLFNGAIGLLTGAGAKGTPQEQAAVFLELAREENAALHPGNGSTSMADAMLKYVAIAQAVQALVDAPAGTGAAQTAAIIKLTAAIQDLGKQWADFGSVRDAFLDSTKKT
jgi:hypothetical protein